MSNRIERPCPLPPNQHCAPTHAPPPMHGAASPLAKCTNRPHPTDTETNYMILLLATIKFWVVQNQFKPAFQNISLPISWKSQKSSHLMYLSAQCLWKQLTINTWSFLVVVSSSSGPECQGSNWQVVIPTESADRGAWKIGEGVTDEGCGLVTTFLALQVFFYVLH